MPTPHWETRTDLPTAAAQWQQSRGGQRYVAADPVGQQVSAARFEVSKAPPARRNCRHQLPRESLTSQENRNWKKHCVESYVSWIAPSVGIGFTRLIILPVFQRLLPPEAHNND